MNNHILFDVDGALTKENKIDKQRETNRMA
jgi:hypothetical protein